MKKKINKKFKIGLSFAGVGLALEFGSDNIYQYIQNEKLIFALEMVKYLCYIIAIYNGSYNIVDNAKIGNEFKKTAEKVGELKSLPIHTKSQELNLQNKMVTKFKKIANEKFKKLSKKKKK